jgi:hypothetical protein
VAKGMGECPLTPVAPAPANTLANTLADATGLPLPRSPVHARSGLPPYLERHVV